MFWFSCLISKDVVGILVGLPKCYVLKIRVSLILLVLVNARRKRLGRSFLFEPPSFASKWRQLFPTLFASTLASPQTVVLTLGSLPLAACGAPWFLACRVCVCRDVQNGAKDPWYRLSCYSYNLIASALQPIKSQKENIFLVIIISHALFLVNFHSSSSLSTLNSLF